MQMQNTHKLKNNNIMQITTLYPFTEQALANEKPFYLNETRDLFNALKSKGYELVSLSFADSKDETTTIWKYKIRVPEICFSEVEKVIDTIAAFWDFNRIDDSIYKSMINYRTNMLHLDWATFC